MKKNLMWLLCTLMAVHISCNTRDGKTNICRVGEYSLHVLTEMQRTVNTGILIHASEDVLKQYAPDGTFPNAVNAVLIKKGDEVWLADTGFGRNIFQQMDSLGVSPEDVDHIILTHMHVDHISGMLRDDKPAFPNADVRVSEKEYQYWSSEEEMMKQPEDRRGNFLLAQKVFSEYGDRIKTERPLPVGSNTEDGILMLEGYGHTPGHVMYLIKSGKDELLIWGDLTHAVTIQTAHPEVSVMYDFDPNQARESRIKALEYVTKLNIPVVGMHIPFGGTGFVEKVADGYSFLFTNIK